MPGMDSLIEHQGFYDYLNHFISGSVLIIGSEIIAKKMGFSVIQSAYKYIGLLPVSEEMNEFLWNVCIISLFGAITFLLGVAVQELYGIMYNGKDNIFREQVREGEEIEDSDDAQNNRAVQRDISKNLKNIFLKGAVRLFRKTTLQSCMRNIFTDDGPITNVYKREWYRKLAKDFINQTSTISGDADVLMERYDVASYFYAYCVYYIQIRNQNRKTEKLRDIAGLSEALSLVFLILAVFSFIVTLISCFQIVLNLQNILGEPLSLTIICLVCAFFSVLMDYRTEKSINSRIRMTLAIYDVEKRHEQEALSSSCAGEEAPRHSSHQ